RQRDARRRPAAQPHDRAGARQRAGTQRPLLRRSKDHRMSVEETVRAQLDRIRAVDSRVHAFLCVDEEGALADARRIDAKERRGPLAGLTVALKDNIVARGMPTTCGSKILANYRAPYEATVVSRLRAADAVILGKTNLDEFAMGSSTENSAYGA